MTIKYPVTRLVEHTDEYFGHVIPDPYRWLEESAETESVASWIAEQNRLAREHLDAAGHLPAITSRLSELWDYPKAGPPWSKAGRWLQFRNTGLQNQDVLWLLAGPDDEGRVLLDPNKLSDDGSASLASAAVSPDGRLLLYGVNSGGSDWATLHVLEIDSGLTLQDEVNWCRGGQGTWLPDSTGFLYARYPTPPEGQEYLAEADNPTLTLHRIGTVQEDDEAIYSRPDDPKLGFGTMLSDDQRYLIMVIWRGTEQKNQVWYRDLEEGLHGEFTPLIGEFQASYEYLGNDGSVFYLQTDDDAERSRVVAVNLARPDEFRDVVPELKEALEYARLLGNRFIAVHLSHGSHVLSSWNLAGERLGEIILPGIGSVFTGRPDRDDEHLYLVFTSFLQPSAVFRTEGGPGRVESVWAPKLDFAADEFETVQEFALSKDGTRVPMFITRRKGTALDGSHRTLLYGYGGFNVNLTPMFSVSRLAWLEQGGVLVTANLRGGAEYGKAWHEAGTLDRKQNVFDDFIACAEHLMAAGYTTSKRLAIQGGSNGGLLVGACMTQRPELFGAVHAAVGVLDMLRYHKFTIGWAWASDYGTSDDESQFRTLLEYSPLHNLQEGTCYPPTLLTTGDRDDRVVPGHSFKFAAALQSAQACVNPVLLRIQTKTGHGHGKPTRLLIEEQADIWAFLLKHLE